jgi:hypothetical protein
MGGYPLGYPDIRQDFRGKGTSASAGGYPLALADIRNGLSRTISNLHQEGFNFWQKKTFLQ